MAAIIYSASLIWLAKVYCSMLPHLCCVRSLIFDLALISLFLRQFQPISSAISMETLFGFASRVARVKICRAGCSLIH